MILQDPHAIVAMAGGFAALGCIVGGGFAWWWRGRQIHKATQQATSGEITPQTCIAEEPAALTAMTVSTVAECPAENRPEESGKEVLPPPLTLLLPPPPPKSIAGPTPRETLAVCAPGRLTASTASTASATTPSATPVQDWSDAELDAMPPDLPPIPRQTQTKRQAPKQPDFRSL